MKKFVSILTVVIFSLALLPMLAPADAADMFIYGGDGGDSGASGTHGKGGGGGAIVSADSRLGNTAGTPPKAGNDHLLVEGRKDSGYDGTGYTANSGTSTIAENASTGGHGGSADVSVASLIVTSLDIKGGIGGTDNADDGGDGGDASLATTGNLTVNGELFLEGGTAATATTGAGGRAILKVGGKLAVSKDILLTYTDEDGVVSFDVKELQVLRVTSLDWGGDELTSKEVKIPTLSLAANSNFRPAASVDLKEVYGTNRINVEGKSAKLTSVDLKMVSGDTLTFNLSGVASGEKMLEVLGGSPVNIASASVSLVSGVAPASQDKHTKIILIDNTGGSAIVSNDQKTLTIVSPDRSGRPVSFEYTITYTANQMIAELTDIHRRGGGSSGCSAVGFAPFAILLILGAATFGKRK